MSKVIAPARDEKERVTVTLREDGMVDLPEEYRRALGLEPGDEVILQLEEGAIRVLSPRAAIERAQRAVRAHVPEGRSLVDELIVERRRDAGSE
jgi:bifunctional DNA-binding transcriptional regulator/antitoxin component of YhaV-PrlF toxin-antitoxin module